MWTYDVHKIGGKVNKNDIDKKTRDEIGKNNGMSGRQVQRYVRLTELVPELLQLVDDKKISFVIAVELSFLPHEIQKIVYKYLKQGKALSKDKVGRLRKMEGSMEEQEEQANTILYEVVGTVKQVYFSLTETQIASYFPKGYSKQQMEDTILTLLDQWSREQGV